MLLPQPGRDVLRLRPPRRPDAVALSYGPCHAVIRPVPRCRPGHPVVRSGPFCVASRGIGRGCLTVVNMFRIRHSALGCLCSVGRLAFEGRRLRPIPRAGSAPLQAVGAPAVAISCLPMCCGGATGMCRRISAYPRAACRLPAGGCRWIAGGLMSGRVYARVLPLAIR